MRHPVLLRWLVPVAITVLLLICVFLYISYNQISNTFNSIFNSPNVEYVLPNDFHGMFVLRFPENEQEIANAQEFVLTDENTYSLTIPPSGIAIIKEKSVLLDFHSLSATYQDGRKLGVRDFDNVKDTDIALCPSRTMGGDGSTWHLVGTQLEMEWLYDHGKLFIAGQGPIAVGTIHKITFIVPDDYTGFFRIIETRDENTDESLIEHENDAWKIYVPISGIIRTTQRMPFRDDHRMSLQYTSGQVPHAGTAYVSNAGVDQMYHMDDEDPQIWGFHIGEILLHDNNTDTTPGLSMSEDK